jgi:signal transduction histidine kinase
MNFECAFPVPSPSTLSIRHGFTESQSESLLRDLILLAAAFTGALTALVLQDDTGVWHRDSSGLSGEQFAALEQALIQGPAHEQGRRQLHEQGLQIIRAQPLMDIYNRSIGTLCVLSSGPVEFSPAQQDGLRLLAQQLQTLLTTDQHRMEARAIPRAPSATSFVPGLVHELGSFLFGISANLDAFEARFADLGEAGKYGANIRRGLDRMSAFIDELREYGDPRGFAWTERELEPLLREALEHHSPGAARNQIGLELHLEGPLPALSMDEQSLRGAFIRLIGLALQQEEAGGRVILHVATTHRGERAMIAGYMDCPNLKFKDVDLARLFEPFYFRTSGLGRLTLPGARRVFESHGGTLTASSGPEGGMRVSFMLPPVLTYPLHAADQP